MTSILPACCSSSSVNAFFTSESVKLSNTIARSKGVTLKASRLAQLAALTPSARTLVTTRNIVYSMRSFYVCVFSRRMKRAEKKRRTIEEDRWPKLNTQSTKLIQLFCRLENAMDIKQCDIRCVDYRCRQEPHSWSSSRHSHVA